MARPTLATHPKFAKLAHRLQSRSLARGALELIWEACYASGDPVVGDSDAVEALADWRGGPGELASALVSCGFLDLQLDANGGQLHDAVYRVHDLEDHAPDYVLKRWEREARRRSAGETIRSVRQAAARAKWLQMSAESLQMDATGRRLQANVLPPAPAPALLHKDSLAIPGGTGTGHGGLEPIRPIPVPYPVGAVTLPFLSVYDRYPNKHRKLEAAAVWQQLAADEPGGEDALAAAILAAFDGGMLRRHPYRGTAAHRPKLETVLAERLWEEPESAPDDPIPVATSPPLKLAPESFAARDAREKQEASEARLRREAIERELDARAAARPNPRAEFLSRQGAPK